MFVLGLQGSPRIKGNTRSLLVRFLKEAEKRGAATRILDLDSMDIRPCKEYILCEKKGFCPIKDDVSSQVYGLLRQADIVVAATPVFFYGPTAQLKALIDRCQTLWARKYRFRLKDPLSVHRKAFLLSVGATKGKSLFEAIDLIARYFFDAIDAKYTGRLTYPGVEKPGDIDRVPSLEADVTRAVETLFAPLVSIKKILFLDRKNSVESRMAATFCQVEAGESYRVVSAGIRPEGLYPKHMEKIMAKKGIDLAFAKPAGVFETMGRIEPDLLVNIGDVGTIPSFFSNAEKITWDGFSGTGYDSEYDLEKLADGIHEKTKRLVAGLAEMLNNKKTGGF